jgi:hypothetical protein
MSNPTPVIWPVEAFVVASVMGESSPITLDKEGGSPDKHVALRLSAELGFLSGLKGTFDLTVAPNEAKLLQLAQGLFPAASTWAASSALPVQGHVWGNDGWEPEPTTPIFASRGFQVLSGGLPFTISFTLGSGDEVLVRFFVVVQPRP